MNQQVVIQCEGHTSLPIDSLIPFQGELKELTKDSYNKFKKQLLELGFSEPITIWQNDKKNFIINGHQRLRTLKGMREEGIHIPDKLPVNFVQARDLKEAKKKVLALTSQYGSITEDGLYEFTQTAGISFDELQLNFRLPEINLGKFNESYLSEPEIKNTGTELDLNNFDNFHHECPKCGFEWDDKKDA
jgi:hypothetical protein